ncbi:hypothetical protein HPULCUR_011710 [Helicostylum pulchrum]|uniref:Viral A-type inclusion protein n=1 Tax=Helicostylum pulchrum TaxID=562976 RepID=A0ABP9YHM0_9FUNG
MVTSSNGPPRRLSSLEAAGVKSSSSTTSSTSTTTNAPKKRLSTTPIPNTTTARPARSSIPSSPSSLPKRPTKTPVKPTSTISSSTRTLSSVKPPLTPLPKKKSSLVSSGTTAPRSPSRASNPISSRATTPHSSSATLTKKKIVEPKPSVTTDIIAIQNLKDKNEKMQAVLSQQETQLEEKETNLTELRTKLEQLESALEQSKNELLVMQEEPSDQPTAASDQQQQEETDQQRQQGLLQTIDSLQNQSNQLKQSFDIERMDLIQQYESAEVKNRDCMEKLREKLENEKLILSGNVLDKERDIEKLKKDMDEMRDNIKEMHQSHQTRLTTLTNQLNKQYTENTDMLKSDHHERELQHKNELEKTNKELELLKSKFQSMIEINQDVNEKYDALQKDSDEEYRKLKDSELAYLTELDQCKLELTTTESKLQTMQEIINERSDQSDVALLQEQHAAQVKEIQQTHDKELDQLSDKLKLKDEQIESLKVQHDQSLQNQSLELKNSHAIQLSDLNMTLSTVQEQHDILKQELEQNKQVNKEFALEIEKGKELETRYNDTTVALANAESNISQKDTEIKTLIVKLETEHDLATKEIKDQHRTILEGLSSTHIKELEHAESQMDFCVQSTRNYEAKLQKLQTNEQVLKDELFKLKNQLQTNHLEMELKLAEKLKLAELKLSQKYHVLQEELEDKSKNSNDYNDQIIAKLKTELKDCQDKYDQSIQELYDINRTASTINNNSDELKTVKEFYENSLAEKEKELKQAKDQLKTKDNDATQVKLQVIIEQHQKELNVLQNQFQSLLDMKDSELNDLSYRIKLKKEKTSKKLDNEKMEVELRNQLYSLEENMKSKSLEMRWLETDSEQNETKLKEQAILIHNLQLSNSHLESSIQQYKDENDQILIHQLQGEIHQF